MIQDWLDGTEDEWNVKPLVAEYMALVRGRANGNRLPSLFLFSFIHLLLFFMSRLCPLVLT